MHTILTTGIGFIVSFKVHITQCYTKLILKLYIYMTYVEYLYNYVGFMNTTWNIIDNVSADDGK